MARNYLNINDEKRSPGGRQFFLLWLPAVSRERLFGVEADDSMEHFLVLQRREDRRVLAAGAFRGTRKFDDAVAADQLNLENVPTL